MKTVAFVAPTACIRVVKEGSIVSDYRKVLLYQKQLSQGEFALRQSTFNDLRQFTHIGHLREYIRGLQPDLIHYHNEPNYPAVYMMQQFDIPLIFDCHDMVSFYKNIINKEEEFIFENAGGVINVSQAMDAFAKKTFNIKGQTEIIYSSVSEKYFCNHTGNKFHGDIVYEGGFTPKLDTHRNYVGLFDTFAEAGHKVHVFPAARGLSGNDFSSLVLHEPLGYEELLPALSQFKFGFVGYVYDNQYSVNSYLDSSLPNKFFEYLAAGLPIIAFQAKTVEKLVREKNIGVVIEKPEDVKAIDEVDYEVLKQNVLRVRSEYSLENQSHKLQRFYETVINSHRIRKGGAKVGRNEPCPCGSGKKHKKCCGR